MAWQEVETDVGNKVGRCAWSVHLKHGGARVSIPQAVVDELRWTKATKFKLQVGAGELEGSLRLVADSSGKIGAKAPPKGGGLLVRLGRWPGLAPRDVDRVTVDHEVGSGALIIKLPTHALAVAPVPRLPAGPAGRDANGVPTAAKRDVSHQFFNDPKKPPALASGTRGGGR